MLKVVVKNEAVARLLYRLPYANAVVKADLRHIGNWRDDATIDRAYSDLTTGNGTSKQTARRRFQDVDPITLELLAQKATPRIHDVGVSSGITSLELFEALEHINLPASFTVSDRYAVYFWIEHRGSVAIYDVDRKLRYAYWGGLYSSARDSALFPISRVVFAQCAKTMPRELTFNEIELYHPALVRVIRAGKVHTRKYDVFTTDAADEYDYVRCMNLLNPKYFGGPELLRALTNIGRSLREGGVFQLGRTMPSGDNHASFFVKRGCSLQHLREFGEGSEVKPLVRQVVLKD